MSEEWKSDGFHGVFSPAVGRDELQLYTQDGAEEAGRAESAFWRPDGGGAASSETNV